MLLSENSSRGVRGFLGVRMRMILASASIMAKSAAASLMPWVRSGVGIASVALSAPGELGWGGGGADRCEWRSPNYGFLSLPTGAFTPPESARLWDSSTLFYERIFFPLFFSHQHLSGIQGKKPGKGLGFCTSSSKGWV